MECNTFSSDVTYAQIINNIFFGKSPGGANNCTFINNLTFQTNQNQLPYGNNSGEGNINGQNPLFVYAPSRETFNYQYNYNLQANSPAKFAGADSTDIGIYGGIYPFPNHINNLPDYSGQPIIPLIKSMTLQNDIINTSGLLRFNAYVIKKD